MNDVNLFGLTICDANLSGATLSNWRLTGVTIDGVALDDMMAAYRQVKQR